MKTGIKIGEIMTRNFVHIKPDMSIKKCAEKMMKERVGSLIVKEDNELRLAKVINANYLD